MATDINNAANDQQLWEVFHKTFLPVCSIQVRITRDLRGGKKLQSIHADDADPILVMAERRKSSVTPSPHSNRKANADVVAGTLLESELRDPEFRKTLLRRDNNRCCVTGWLDQQVWGDKGMPVNEAHAFLEGAHIIPVSFATWAGEEVLFPRRQTILSGELTPNRVRKKPRTGGKPCSGASQRSLIID